MVRGSNPMRADLRGLNFKTFLNRDKGDEQDKAVLDNIPFIPFIRVNNGFGVEIRCYPCSFRGICVPLLLFIDLGSTATTVS
jgi:hypothetical protein